MKYSIYLNQVGIAKLGLLEQTDIIDWVIVDYILGWFNSKKAQKIIFEGEAYVLISYEYLLKSMPLLRITHRSKLSYRLNKLKKIGLIKTKLYRGKMYINLTDKVSDILFFEGTCTEKEDSTVRLGGLPPSPLGDDLVRLGGRPRSIRGTEVVPQGGHNIILYNISDNELENIPSSNEEGNIEKPLANSLKEVKERKEAKVVTDNAEKIYDKEASLKSIKDLKDVEKQKVDIAVMNLGKIRNKKKPNKKDLELYFLAVCSLAGVKGSLGDNRPAVLNNMFRLYAEIGVVIYSIIDYSIANWSNLRTRLKKGQFVLPKMPSLHFIYLRYNAIIDIMSEQEEKSEYSKTKVYTIEEAMSLNLI